MANTHLTVTRFQSWTQAQYIKQPPHAAHSVQCILSSPICCFSARKLVQKKKEKRYQNYDLSRALPQFFTLTYLYQLEDCGVRVPRKFRRRHDLPLNAQVREAILQKIPEFYEICSQTGGGGHRFLKEFHKMPVFFEGWLP